MHGASRWSLGEPARPRLAMAAEIETGLGPGWKIQIRAEDFRNDVFHSEPARSPDVMIIFAMTGRPAAKFK